MLPVTTLFSDVVWPVCQCVVYTDRLLEAWVAIDPSHYVLGLQEE